MPGPIATSLLVFLYQALCDEIFFEEVFFLNISVHICVVIKIHLFLKQCFARFTGDTIWGYSQLMPVKVSLKIS